MLNKDALENLISQDKNKNLELKKSTGELNSVEEKKEDEPQNVPQKPATGKGKI